MRKELAEAKAIGALIDTAIAQGYPKTAEGRSTMGTAKRWMEKITKKRGGEIDGKGKSGCM